MKKKFLTFILCICFIIPAMFCLSACTQSPDIQFKVEDGYIQYYDGKSWNDLIAIESLKGLPGDDGEDADVWIIGQNGNWFKNGQDTGKQAVATNGQPGNGIKSITKDDINSTMQKTIYIIELDNGTKYSFEVINGLDGSDGDDAETPTISISDEGYWIINGQETDKKAIGTDGSAGKDADVWAIGQNGNWFKNGQDTGTQAIGKDGTDGTSYYVHIKYADEEPTSTTTLKTTASAWMGIYSGTSKTAPTTYSSYTWYCIKGQDATYNTYKITYEYGAAKQFFNDAIDGQDIKTIEWLTTLPTIKDEYNDSFLGWFIQGTNKEVSNYDFVGGNVTLEARFDFTSAYAPAGLYKNGKYIKTWQQLIEDGDIVVEDGILADGYVVGDLCIDNTVTKIGNRAFDNALFTGVSMADSVTQIGSWAFADCSNLTTVIIGKNVEFIEHNAFYGCEGLRNVTIGENVQSIDIAAFFDCNNLTSVDLPYPRSNNTWKIYNSGNVISQDAMLLTDKQVAWYLNKGYELKQTFTITIDEGRYDCVSTNTKLILVSAENKTDIEEVEIAYPLTGTKTVEIAAFAFSGCENLKAVTITADVDYIGDDAFADCDNLTTITFEEKEGYKWQVQVNEFDDFWRDAEVSELFNLTKEGKQLKRVAE